MTEAVDYGGTFEGRSRCHTKSTTRYRRFDPHGFEAEQWVEAAKGLGAAYLVITAKHHDGFCLWGTQQTDYKITSPESPFTELPTNYGRVDIVWSRRHATRPPGRPA